MLTHGNIISMIAGAALSGVSTASNDVHLSYLPLAHIFERAVQGIVYCEGSACGFFQGSVLKLFDDIQVLRPTIFASVPRLWNRLYDKVNATIRDEGGLKQKLFNMGFNSKQDGLKSGGPPTSGFWDMLIFSKLKVREARVQSLCLLVASLSFVALL